MNDLPSSDRPQAGDLIIRQDSKQAHRYVVGSFEHGEQLIYDSRSAAIAHGTRYALARGVSLWQADDGERFRLIFSPSINATEKPS